MSLSFKLRLCVLTDGTKGKELKRERDALFAILVIAMLGSFYPENSSPLLEKREEDKEGTGSLIETGSQVTLFQPWNPRLSKMGRERRRREKRNKMMNGQSGIVMKKDCL